MCNAVCFDHLVLLLWKLGWMLDAAAPFLFLYHPPKDDYVAMEVFFLLRHHQ